MDGTPENPLFFEDEAAWRRWLRRNHARATEAWVLTYKVRTGRKCLTYQQTLDEALCHGWIDNRLRHIDDERHMWRFVPRKPNSIWSLKNRRSAERLIKEGRMTPLGLKKIDDAKKSGKWDEAIAPSRPPPLPGDLKAALMKDKAAWRNFQSFANSYRTTYIYWVSVARRKETRKRRIEEVVRRAAKNQKQFIA